MSIQRRAVSHAAYAHKSCAFSFATNRFLPSEAKSAIFDRRWCLFSINCSFPLRIVSANARHTRGEYPSTSLSYGTQCKPMPSSVLPQYCTNLSSLISRLFRTIALSSRSPRVSFAGSIIPGCVKLACVPKRTIMRRSPRSSDILSCATVV